MISFFIMVRGYFHCQCTRRGLWSYESTPNQIYQKGSGGGARIVDKFIERKTTLKTWTAQSSC